MRSHSKISSNTIVIDENQIDVSEPLNFQLSTSTARVIIRMPAVPTEYFQVTSFSAWYENRIAELKAYAIRQRATHADKSILFDVLVGSKHEVLRQSKKRDSSALKQCREVVC